MKIFKKNINLDKSINLKKIIYLQKNIILKDSSKKDAVTSLFRSNFVQKIQKLISHVLLYLLIIL